MKINIRIYTLLYQSKEKSRSCYWFNEYDAILYWHNWISKEKYHLRETYMRNV